MFTFYQSFMVSGLNIPKWHLSRIPTCVKQFSALEGSVIKGKSNEQPPLMKLHLAFSTATEYWTETNIADGLTALATCIEVRFHTDTLEPS